MSEDATSSTKRSAEALTASTVPAPASTSALPDSTTEETGTPAKRVKLDLEPSSDAIGAMLTDSPSVRPETSGRRGGGGAKGAKSVGKSGDRRDKHGGKKGDKAAGGNNSREAKVMREWGTRAPADGETKDEGEDINKPERLAKKKVALLIGYNGGGYSGSQINPGVSTIEGAIFDALVKAGAVSADNSDNPQKVGLSRAARTDAGVHAAVNCLSLKMILSPSLLPPGMPLPEYINSFLPPTVRVWGILRVQGSFSPRTLCDSRQYQYTLPTHVFLGPKPGCSMDIWLKKSRSKSGAAVDATLPAVEGASTEAAVTVPATASATATEAAASEAIAASDAFWAAQPAESTFLDDLTAKRAWRISPGLVESARTFVKTYEGSHNYCNFTVGKDFRDRSNQRVMRKLEVSDPFLVNDVEYVTIGFLGQSFMLHQIRKMIGLTILAVRSSTPASLILETFGPSRIHIPKAPGLGLLLCEPHYAEYNKKVVEANSKLDSLVEAKRLDAAGAEEQKRDIIDIGIFKESIENFKQAEVYTRMWEVEQRDAVFSKWLNFLDVYSGPDFEYINSKGVIPEIAKFKKGENNEKVRAALWKESTGAAVKGEDVQEPSDDEAPVKGDDKEMEG